MKNDITIMSRHYDYSNVGQRIANALKSIGARAKAYVQHPSPFQYPKQAQTFRSLTRMFNIANQSKIIEIQNSYFDARLHYNRLGVVGFHGAHEYRMNSELFNKELNSIVDVTLIQTFDLLGLGAKNEVWFIPPVEVDELQPNFTTGDVISIGHFPSITKTKGTEIIYPIVESKVSKTVRFQYETDTCDWSKNILRMKNCDIYIDACKPTLDGKIYGEWGMAALEACALGTIVITHSSAGDAYECTFGQKHPLLIANSAVELQSRLDEVLSLNTRELRNMKKRCRTWVEECHSYHPAVDRWVQKVYRPIKEKKGVIIDAFE